MKQYKLLKDIPNFEAGQIFTLDQKEAIIYTDTFAGRFTFGVGLIKNFDEWFEEIKTFEIPDKFEMGFWTIFYHIEDGYYATHIPSDEFEDSYEDHLKHSMAIGWAFETEEETEKHIEWLKAREVLLGYTTKNGMFNVCHNSVEGFKVVRTADVWSEMMFETKEDAERSIERHEKEWKIYLNVEDN